MVRAHMKQTSEEKKDASKKTSKAPVKSKADAGVWPCAIEGCGKVFAREADLKRHMRTTKLHSAPAFACPQCDATFTRTDALRRHQKSRHNGVVIEPDAEKDKDGPVASGSDSQSPGPSSAPVTKEKAPETTSTSPPVATVPPGLPPPNTPSGYYRQQTVIPPPYQTPMSGSWYPPWVPENMLRQGSVVFPGYPVYYPMPVPPYPQLPGQPVPNGQPSNEQSTQASATQPSAPVIDPSLESTSASSSTPAAPASSNTTTDSRAQDALAQLQITHAAMQAVFDAAIRHQEKLDAENVEERATQIYNAVAASTAADNARQGQPAPTSMSQTPTVAPPPTETQHDAQGPPPGASSANVPSVPPSSTNIVQNETPMAEMVSTGDAHVKQ